MVDTKTQSKHKYENKRKTYYFAACSFVSRLLGLLHVALKIVRHSDSARDIGYIFSPCTKLQVKLPFLLFLFCKRTYCFVCGMLYLDVLLRVFIFFSILIFQPFFSEQLVFGAFKFFFRYVFCNGFLLRVRHKSQLALSFFGTSCSPVSYLAFLDGLRDRNVDFCGLNIGNNFCTSCRNSVGLRFYPATPEFFYDFRMCTPGVWPSFHCG